MQKPAASDAGQAAFHVALYSGVILRADAISDSLRLKLDILTGLAAAGLPVRVTAFTQATDHNHDRIRRVANVHELTRHREFHDADLHIFEFGIHYNLFNGIVLVDPKPVLAAYHNVTPPELADPTLRPTLEASLVQKHNLFWAQRIACDSEFNRDDLIAFGLPAERLTVLHLPPAIRAKHAPTRSETVRLLYVGRFVQAKGVLDLVEAVGQVVRSGRAGFTVALAGNRAFSSTDCIEAIQHMVARDHLDDVVRMVLSPSDDELGRLYAESDALVIPSYHEGFCLPVIEAMAAGCYVIAYDAGNLPNIVGGLGTLVRAGDVSALAGAIRTYVDVARDARDTRTAMRLPVGAGGLHEDEWRRAVAIHVESYSPEAYARGFLELVSATAAGARGDRFIEALSRASTLIGAGARS